MSAPIKILYNNCYGGFHLSAAFAQEYKKRTGNDIDRNRVEFWNTGPDSFRCDPVAISIFEEFGSEWSSGANSEIEVYEIPSVFARYWDITEYDGEETVTVNIMEAYADILHGFMDSGDLGVLVKQYQTIKTASQRLRRPVDGGIVSAPIVKGDSEFMQSYKAGEWRAEDLTAIFSAMAGGVKDIGLVNDEEDGSSSPDSIGHT